MTDTGDGVRYRSMESRRADADRLLSYIKDSVLPVDRNHNYYTTQCIAQAHYWLRGEGEQAMQPNFWLTDGLVNGPQRDPDARPTMILLDGTVVRPRLRYADPHKNVLDSLLRRAMNVPHDWEPSDADY